MLLQISPSGSYEWLALMMFVAFFFILMSGYPVAFGFAGTGILFGLIGMALGAFDANSIRLLPNKWFGTMSDFQLLAVPFFIFLGAILEKSGLAEDMLQTAGMLFGGIRAGLALAVVIVGAMLAATTGVVAASIIAMGIISLPTMLKYGYDKRLAVGVIMASGTLAQVIPPSLVLVLVSDQLGVSVGDLFAGSFVPGLILAGSYAVYSLVVGYTRKDAAPPLPAAERTLRGWPLAKRTIATFVPTVGLILVVLGTIFFGIATPTEAGGVGAAFAMLLAAAKHRLTWKGVKAASDATVRTTTMVIMILFCSTMFALVFGGLGGDVFATQLLTNIPGGLVGFLLVSNAVIFVMGMFFEFIEIVYIALPLLVPAAELLIGRANYGMVWFGVLMGINLQVGFLSPPVGFSLFYMQSIVPKDKISTFDVHMSAWPFVAINVVLLFVLAFFPALVTWLPSVAFAGR